MRHGGGQFAGLKDSRVSGYTVWECNSQRAFSPSPSNACLHACLPASGVNLWRLEVTGLREADGPCEELLHWLEVIRFHKQELEQPHKVSRVELGLCRISAGITTPHVLMYTMSCCSTLPSAHHARPARRPMCLQSVEGYRLLLLQSTNGFGGDDAEATRARVAGAAAR